MGYGRHIGGGDKPVIFEVEINHDCWFCDVTERDKDASMVSSYSSIKGDDITNVTQITSPTLKKDLELIRKHPLVKKLSVLNRTPNEALLMITSSYKAMTYNILHKTNVTLLESPITRNGVDSEILLAPSHKAMDELLSRWKGQKGYHDVKLKKKRYMKPEDSATLDAFRTSGFFDLKSAKELLTGKQLDVFQLACDYGYYNTPKKISIEELAQRLDSSPSTIAEHLRKAESKLLPMLMKVMRKL